ncbi:hypothetical protein BDF14DRAFT_1330297 [Spinellus fusiger]|nr:hypothetical protein BDF14DRAFT_1330297 [Spinellus fusiger]
MSYLNLFCLVFSLVCKNNGLIQSETHTANSQRQGKQVFHPHGLWRIASWRTSLFSSFPTVCLFFDQRGKRQDSACCLGTCHFLLVTIKKEKEKETLPALIFFLHSYSPYKDIP